MSFARLFELGFSRYRQIFPLVSACLSYSKTSVLSSYTTHLLQVSFPSKSTPPFSKLRDPQPNMSAASTLRQRSAAVPKSTGPASDSGHSSSDDELITYGDFPAYTPPSFTIKEILNAIPAHCFERSALRSGAYVVGDFAMVAALMYAASFIEPALGFEGEVVKGYSGLAAKWAAWATYWVLAGFVYTGIWICGEFLARAI